MILKNSIGKAKHNQIEKSAELLADSLVKSIAGDMRQYYNEQPTIELTSSQKSKVKQSSLGSLPIEDALYEEFVAITIDRLKKYDLEDFHYKPKYTITDTKVLDNYGENSYRQCFNGQKFDSEKDARDFIMEMWGTLDGFIIEKID